MKLITHLPETTWADKLKRYENMRISSTSLIHTYWLWGNICWRQKVLNWLLIGLPNPDYPVVCCSIFIGNATKQKVFYWHLFWRPQSRTRTNVFNISSGILGKKWATTDHSPAAHESDRGLRSHRHGSCSSPCVLLSPWWCTASRRPQSPATQGRDGREELGLLETKRDWGRWWRIGCSRSTGSRWETWAAW